MQYVCVCAVHECASENQRNELTSVHSISFGSLFFYVWRSAEKFKIQTSSPSKCEWKQTKMCARARLFERARESWFLSTSKQNTRTCAIGVQQNTESNTELKELRSYKMIMMHSNQTSIVIKSSFFWYCNGWNCGKVRISRVNVSNNFVACARQSLASETDDTNKEVQIVGPNTIYFIIFFFGIRKPPFVG